MNISNKLTITRIVLAPVFMALFLIDNIYCRLAALLVFIIASITDWWDGHLARKHGHTTHFGKFMDPLADKILTSSALIAFASLEYVPMWMIILIVIREFSITGLRSLAISRGLVISPSMGGKLKTVLQMTSIIVILVYINAETMAETLEYTHPFLGSPLVYQFFAGMILITMLVTLLTGFDYLRRNTSILKAVVK